MEGFIPPLFTAFGIGKVEWARDLSLFVPRLTLEEIDALSVSTICIYSSPFNAAPDDRLPYHSVSFMFVSLECTVPL